MNPNLTLAMVGSYWSRMNHFCLDLRKRKNSSVTPAWHAIPAVLQQNFFFSRDLHNKGLELQIVNVKMVTFRNESGNP